MKFLPASPQIWITHPQNKLGMVAHHTFPRHCFNYKHWVWVISWWSWSTPKWYFRALPHHTLVWEPHFALECKTLWLRRALLHSVSKIPMHSLWLWFYVSQNGWLGLYRSYVYGVLLFHCFLKSSLCTCLIMTLGEHSGKSVFDLSWRNFYYNFLPFVQGNCIDLNKVLFLH